VYGDVIDTASHQQLAAIAARCEAEFFSLRFADELPREAQTRPSRGVCRPTRHQPPARYQVFI